MQGLNYAVLFLREFYLWEHSCFYIRRSVWDILLFKELAEHIKGRAVLIDKLEGNAVGLRPAA